jgi:pimeloyl-ACP methyl ester carboxylesterase
MTQEKIDNSFDKTLVFVPGIGADHRLFRYQTEFFFGSLAIDWIDPLSGESLEQYSVRLANYIRGQLPLGVESGSVVVCGLSLGGMVAPYVAGELGAAGYILLCSIRHPSQFPRRYYLDWLFMRNCVFCRVVRANLIKFSAKLFSRFPRFLNFIISPNVIEQFIKTPTKRFAGLSRMMFDWAYKRRSNDELRNNNSKFDNIPSIHIHGNRDLLLPIKLTNPDIIIDGGGHILSLTHPDKINEIIQNFIKRIN